MAGERLSGLKERQRRRWSFAGAVFDEANWTLTVDGQRAVVETKPLELLRELLLHAGDLVPKDQLMDSIWPDVEVVEASLPTAIAKLRRALGDDRRDRPIIETAPRLGYRLAVPVEVEELPDPSLSPPRNSVAGNRQRRATDRRQGQDERREPSHRSFLLVAAIGAVAILAALFVATAETAPTQTAAQPRAYTKADVYDALRKVDVETVEKLLAEGWDPDAWLDVDRNGALNILLQVCEWNPGHDRDRMLLMARTLFDGGAELAPRNAWGDTPYSIAKTDRYCGPDHPVTKMLHRLCYEGVNPVGARCLADYRRDAAGNVLRQDPPQLVK